MKTPICDFVNSYIKSNALRAHMPGHKGKNIIGFEKYDITEFFGADSLYEACGIIKSSEDNAGKIFGANTFYSTEGSSQCIRAMLYLACRYANQNGKKPIIAAARNVHKTFLSAATLLDFDIVWLYDQNNSSYLSCSVSAETLEKAFADAQEAPTAVYLTNPDYLGNMTDIKAIADACHKYGVLLLVDNAHGAYLKFLDKSHHPIDLGADIVCDSAHKTLPVLTGGAYLHISHNAPKMFKEHAKNALGMFGSTSPSYLILQSLDKANEYLSTNYKTKLCDFIVQLKKLKEKLLSYGYAFYGDEALKLTFDIKKYGYTGYEFAKILNEKNIYCEFYDNDFVVMMLTAENNKEELERLKEALLSVPKRDEILEKPPVPSVPKRAMSVKAAIFSQSEVIPVTKSLGRVLASHSVSCPPAVPIVVCGEEIDKNAIDCFLYYGIQECEVVKKSPSE